MKRFAFTLLELVFVIIVIGILAVAAMPNFNRDLLADATEQVAGHIRYTQHLAMTDDRYDPANPQWYSEIWVFRLRQVADVNNGGENEWYYEVFSDSAPYNGNSTIAEEAIDPLTGETLGNGGNGVIDNTVDDFKIINLRRTYGIVNVVYRRNGIQENALRQIAFDNNGRPYWAVDANPGGNWRNFLLVADITIELTGSDGRVSVITVRPETGYVSTFIP